MGYSCCALNIDFLYSFSLEGQPRRPQAPLSVQPTCLSARDMSPLRRHGMLTSRLPIDICENIVDACHESPGGWLRESSYPVWIRTAMVCSDWLPRSRFNLFQHIEIRIAAHLDLLFRTLSEKPYVAQLILEVEISPREKECIPFVRLLHPLILTRCVRVYLHLHHTNWRALPARYADTSLYPCHGVGADPSLHHVRICQFYCYPSLHIHPSPAANAPLSIQRACPYPSQYPRNMASESMSIRESDNAAFMGVWHADPMNGRTRKS